MPKSLLQRNRKLKKLKHQCLINTQLDKAFKGTVVNRALPSLHGGSLEITLTVPLKSRTHSLYLPDEILDAPLDVLRVTEQD